jgi:hypothetical protein
MASQTWIVRPDQRSLNTANSQLRKYMSSRQVVRTTLQNGVPQQPYRNHRNGIALLAPHQAGDWRRIALWHIKV